MGTTPASGKRSSSSFLSRHEDRMRRVDSAITRLRNTAQASRLVARAGRNGPTVRKTRETDAQGPRL